jgi:hypothetical protein
MSDIDSEVPGSAEEPQSEEEELHPPPAEVPEALGDRTAGRDIIDMDADFVGEVNTGSSQKQDQRLTNVIHVYPRQPKEELESQIKEDDETPPAELPPVDVTTELGKLTSSPLELEPDLVNSWRQRLLDDHLLILSSFDNETLRSAGQMLVDSLNSEKRFLNLDGREVELLSPSLDSLLHEKLPWPEHTTIVAVASDLVSQTYVDAIARGWTASLDARQRLRQQKRHLLLLTTPELVPPTEDLAYFLISFVEPRLRARFSEEKAQEWALEIENQRQSGNWEGREKRFWELFDASLRRGTLEQAIRRRVWTGRAEGTSSGPRIGNSEDLTNTALFLATFFPSLPLEDYDSLIRRLLQGRVKKLKSTTFVLTEEGEGGSKENEEERQLTTIWTEEYERVFEKAKLIVLQPTMDTVGTSLRTVRRGPVIDFELPEIRDQVRAEFLGIHYLQLVRLFGAVRELGLLYDPSPPIMEGTLELMQTMAEVDTHRYGEEMLLELLQMGKEKSQGSASFSGSPDRSQATDRGLLFSRIYLLLRAFLKEPTLQEAVHRFLNRLIGDAQHDTALELVKRLRFATGFDQVYWWKQLLARGNEEAKVSTFQEMSAALRTGGSQFPDTLRKVGGWVVQQGEGARSESTERAHQLLYEQFDFSLHRSRFRQPGTWPPEDPLQAALCDLRPANNDLPIIEWLFHPDFATFLQEERSPDEGGGSKWVLRTDQGHYPTLIMWRWILNPVKTWLRIQKDFGKSWTQRFRSLPDKLTSPRADMWFPPSFQALVLADLALSLHGVTHSPTEDAEPVEALASVVSDINEIVNKETQRMLLESYWSAMRLPITELMSSSFVGGTPEEEVKRVIARLEAQDRSLGRLLELFRQQPDTTCPPDVQGETECNP